MTPPSLLSRALDATIVLSFDRSGYRRHAASFRPEDVQVDLTGQVAVVTGANSGIGKATSRALAERGASRRRSRRRCHASGG